MVRTLYGLCGADHRPFSPHVWKTMLSLAHKGLDYDRQFVGFTQIPSIENGTTALVPVLRDGNELIRDSFDIAPIWTRPIRIVRRCLAARAARRWRGSSKAGRN